MIQTSRFVVGMVALVSALSWAPEVQAWGDKKVTVEDVKRVLDYYEHGQDGGPLLTHVEICNGIDRAKFKEANTCTEGHTPEGLKKGDTLAAFMIFFAPKDAKYEDVSIQWIHDGTVRLTREIKVQGAMHYRTFFTTPANKPGKWEFKVLWKGQELGHAKVSVAGS